MFQSEDIDQQTGLKRKQEPYLHHAVYKRPILEWRTYRLEVRRWIKVFYANGNDKKMGEAILITDKTDFKQKP